MHILPLWPAALSQCAIMPKEKKRKLKALEGLSKGANDDGEVAAKKSAKQSGTCRCSLCGATSQATDEHGDCALQLFKNHKAGKPNSRKKMQFIVDGNVLKRGGGILEK